MIAQLCLGPGEGGVHSIEGHFIEVWWFNRGMHSDFVEASAVHFCRRCLCYWGCAFGFYSRLAIVQRGCAQFDFVEVPAFHFFVGYRGETKAPTIEKRSFCTKTLNNILETATWGAGGNHNWAP